MFHPIPRFRIAWIAGLTGLLWLWFGARHSALAFCIAMPPGILLVTGGFGLLLLPGDRRLCHVMAAAGVFGVLLAVPFLAVVGILQGLLLAILSGASFCIAGTASLRLDTRPDCIPALKPSVSLSAQAALDDAMLSALMVLTKPPTLAEAEEMARESREAYDLFKGKGWTDAPASYHVEPPALTDPTIVPARTIKMDYERLAFESGYEPRLEEPGRERWLSYRANRTAYAWVLRHEGSPRPWLVCIHGYQMGFPFADLYSFEAKHYHEKLGLNLLFPVLPIHGPRKKSRISGDGYFSAYLMDACHAEAQAMWDIRRMLSWIRSQGGPRVGVHGLSLGGYNTALLACLDGNLACAIPGVPATDFLNLFWRHAPALQLRAFEEGLIGRDQLAEVMRVISPLALEPKVPLEHRFIFAGLGDQQVPPEHVLALWRHWGEPRIYWYQGAHMTFRLDRRVKQATEETLMAAGVAV